MTETYSRDCFGNLHQRMHLDGSVRDAVLGSIDIRKLGARVCATPWGMLSWMEGSKEHARAVDALRTVVLSAGQVSRERRGADVTGRIYVLDRTGSPNLQRRKEDPSWSGMEPDLAFYVTSGHRGKGAPDLSAGFQPRGTSPATIPGLSADLWARFGIREIWFADSPGPDSPARVRFLSVQQPGGAPEERDVSALIPFLTAETATTALRALVRADRQAQEIWDRAGPEELDRMAAGTDSGNALLAQARTGFLQDLRRDFQESLKESLETSGSPSVPDLQ